MWTWSQCSGSILVWRWTACLCPIHFSRDTINRPGTNAPPYAHTTSKMMSVWHHNPSLMMSLSLFVYICDRQIQLCVSIHCQQNSEKDSLCQKWKLSLLYWLSCYSKFKSAHKYKSKSLLFFFVGRKNKKNLVLSL